MAVNFKKIRKNPFGTLFEIETGRLAKLANGSVLARYGDTMVLATAVAEDEKIEGTDFLPLTVNYQEKTYAAGKIPGGYIKREGRPSEKEVLTSRLIDRPVRPLIPREFTYSTQVIVTVISSDQENDPDVLSVTAASAALTVSDIPFGGPLAAVRVGKIGGKLVCNPTRTQLQESTMDIIVAGTSEAVVMVEGEAKEVPESEIVEAILFGHESLQPFIEAQHELIEGTEIVKRQVPEPAEDPALVEEVRAFVAPRLREALVVPSKEERHARTKALYEELVAALLPRYPECEEQMARAFDKLKKEFVRELIVKERLRVDGRGYKDIREIWGEVGFLPRTHGSALFTRGETQALVAATLGTTDD